MTTTVNQLLNTKDDEIFSVTPDALVIDAIKMMDAKKVGALLVTEKNNKLVGIVSERDYTRKVILKDRSSAKTKVSEIMTKNPMGIDKNALAAKALSLMNEKKITSLYVFEKKNRSKTIGIVHIHNILQFSIT